MKTQRYQGGFFGDWAGIALLSFLLLCCFGIETTWSEELRAFRVASYNVENLFDLEHQGGEYDEYIPGGPSGWGETSAAVKFSHIARVADELAADILALQEVESEAALRRLQIGLDRLGKNYSYRFFCKTPGQAVGCAVLSRFPAVYQKEIGVDRGGNRGILRLDLDICGRTLVLFVNHWPSKKHPESARMASARALKDEINRLKPGCEYIVVGDLNSNYNENKTFFGNKALNDTGGLTGINHGLNTVIAGKPVLGNDVATCGRCLYNLWLDLPPDQRWSYVFRGRGGSLDHVLIPQALSDRKGIRYRPDSFNRYAPDYLVHGRTIERWRMTGTKTRRHLGRGYSDHLPVYADFELPVK